ncbi:retrovirus-related pol polyprotein from transposon TNT 1-94, partial [Tanacetum coccineum]
TGSSSRNTSSYYVTHPTSVVDYEDEYQQDDVHTNSEDPLVSAMLNQAIIQGDRVNIQSRNSGNARRNNRQAYVQEEIVEGSNAPNETENVQRILRTSSSGNTSTVQCYNCSGKGHYAKNCPKLRVRDSKYFIIQPADNTSEVGPSYDSAFISEVNLMMKLFRSDDKFSQMLRQYESTPEFGSGSGGCGDDEIADDEDGGEDEEDEEDGDS